MYLFLTLIYLYKKVPIWRRSCLMKEPLCSGFWRGWPCGTRWSFFLLNCKWYNKCESEVLGKHGYPFWKHHNNANLFVWSPELLIVSVFLYTNVFLDTPAPQSTGKSRFDLLAISVSQAFHLARVINQSWLPCIDQTPDGWIPCRPVYILLFNLQPPCVRSI